ncbi:pilus assembly protein [Massilia sp. Dwa41.01b]|uniref:pilus assembly protein n=1 Tax=Massilia sp. Dwa41.01b TaxID=2709302 RepID=UPI001E52A61D|nr:PilC/PilY family type IV pilus protein [Massilia sp. Dwa41.01b]
MDIVPARNSYPRVTERSDCAGTTCTYDEEMTNFANWYAYYKTRNQMMKTSVGLAFQPVGEGYKVGIVSLSTAAAEGGMTIPQPFIGKARADWYDALYKMNGNNSTPLRQALHAVGKMYANLAPYKRSAGNEVVRFPCEQNFTFMTTDGYWNGPAAADVVSNDNVESTTRFCSKDKGCVDPTPQSANSLADIALYWYNGGSNTESTSLRTTLENWDNEGLVPGRTGIDNKRLHMNTYTLGLGVDGIMTYDKNYGSPTAGTDFHKLITGVATGCPWNNNGPYVWPNPATNDDTGGATYQSRVDDLWHAAINGHGKYFSASAPLEVVAGLSSALSDIQEKQGAASAAATSTPNVSVDDNDLFAATFTTVKWYGELESKEIDVSTGAVSRVAKWNTSTLLGAKVGALTDTRRILMRDVDTGGLKEFRYNLMTPTEQGWFDNKCGQLDQCPTLTVLDRLVVNDGRNIVGWLRGQQQFANNRVLREYARKAADPEAALGQLPLVLGDIASSKPAYMRRPTKNYEDFDDPDVKDPAFISGYGAFKSAKASRAPTVFVGANDGMLHAFDGETGDELWAYVPRITMKKLYRQASTTYGTNHQFTVDGSPEVVDVKIDGAWRTVLVGGLNAGGRGYYALDVTDPADPKLLWELCADAAVCGKHDDDIGLTFGNPQIGVWTDGSGGKHWAAFLSSGYNNIPGTDGVTVGTGKGWLYVVDIANGTILSKTGTDGSVETPSGLARITAISKDPHTDPRVTHVYGGDNLGRMWRFDYSAGGDARLLKMGDAGVNQPITTRPDVTICEARNPDGTVVSRRVVAFGTGRLLDQGDIRDTSVQAAYVLADNGKALGSVPVATMVNRQLSVIAGTGTAYAISGPDVNLALGTADGWSMRFDRNLGERVNLDPKIIDGALNVVTNVPTTPTGCKVGGSSNVYQLNVCTAQPLMSVAVTSGNRTTYVAAAGQTLSNSAAAVGTTVISLPSGDLRQITTNADGGIISTTAVNALPLTTKISGWRRVRE